MERARRDGIAEAVRFLGMLAPTDVAEIIASADAGLFASYVEGFSVAMVELIACGRPIISTEVSGAHELIIEGKNGFIVRERDPNAYAQRMLDVLNLPAPEQFCRRLAVEGFSMESFWTRLEHLWAPFRVGTNGTESVGNLPRLRSNA
jgi:glycosyltransferase involved in cell wall biosynthesis